MLRLDVVYGRDCGLRMLACGRSKRNKSESSSSCGSNAVEGGYMRFFLLIAVSSTCLNAMNNNNNNPESNSYWGITARYCCSIVMESIVSRYATAERQRLLISGNIQQDAQEPSLEERTCRACCARHWGKICCCCSCCCVSMAGGTIAFAGGITQGIEAIKGAKIVAGVMQ